MTVMTDGGLTDPRGMIVHPVSALERAKVLDLIEGILDETMIARMLGLVAPEPELEPEPGPEPKRKPYPDMSRCKAGLHDMNLDYAWAWSSSATSTGGGNWCCHECKKDKQRAYYARLRGKR